LRRSQHPTENEHNLGYRLPEYLPLIDTYTLVPQSQLYIVARLRRPGIPIKFSGNTLF